MQQTSVTRTQIPLVDLKLQYKSIAGEIGCAIQRVLDNTNFVQGEEVREFEESFAKYLGRKSVVGVGSGTAALQLSLLACGIGPGDEVITTSMTFAATAESIVHVGAIPVFVDIDPDTFLIDPLQVEKAITSKTKAIVPVHLYGRCADMHQLSQIAAAHGLWLIEDAAQAHGAFFAGKRCGTFGHLACFSFYPGKNLGAYGDAGAITGDDEGLLDRLRRLRDHGRTGKYEHSTIGYCERLDTIQAAVLNVKLPFLDGWNGARRERAKAYDAVLQGLDLVLPTTSSLHEHVFHLYVVRSRKRDELRSYLKDKGISTGVHYPIPLHHQPAFVDRGYGRVKLPHTEMSAKEVISLPMYPELTMEQIYYIGDCIREFFNK